MKIDASRWYGENRARALVSREVFLGRIQRGWKAQRALMEPLGDRQVPGAKGRHLPRAILHEVAGGPTATEYKAFNLTRTMKVWSEVVGITPDNIRNGISRYGSLERFLHYIGWYPGKARYVDDEVDLVVNLKPEAEIWVPGRPVAKKVAAPKQYRRINLDDDLI